MPNTTSSGYSSPTVSSYWYNASSQSNKTVNSPVYFSGARAANNGNTPFLVKEIGAFVSGYGNLSRTCSFFLFGDGSASGTSSFTVPAAGVESYTGLKPLSSGVFFVTGGSSGLFEITLGGNAYIGTIPGDGVSPYLLLNNTTTQVDQSSSPKGLWAAISYAQVPSTPSLSISANGSYGFSASWTTPDWGDTASGRGYELYIRQGGTTIYSNTSISSSINSLSIFSGLSASTSYTAEIYAKNELSGYSGSPKSVAGTGSFTTAAVPVPTWTGTLGNGQVGVNYGTRTITATGAASIARTSGSLPPGLIESIGSNTYSLYSTPTASGTYSLTIRARNAGGDTFTTQTIGISPPTTPSWPDTLFKDGNAGQSYGSDSVTASNADYVTATPSSVAGLTVSVSGSTVTLSGTPSSSADGNYQISAIAYSVPNNGVRIQTPATLSVTINGVPRPTWQDTSIETLTAINVPYLSSVGATNAVSYSFVGSSPSWLSLNASTGGLSGTPTNNDVSYLLSSVDKQFTIRATGANGDTADFTFPGIDVVHPIKIYKESSSSFDYPSQQVRRRDGSSYVNVQWVKRWNGSSWVDADIN